MKKFIIITIVLAMVIGVFGFLDNHTGKYFGEGETRAEAIEYFESKGYVHVGSYLIGHGEILELHVHD